MMLQPGDIAVDYSFARPDPQAMVAAGVKLVVRYISPSRAHPKNLNAAERDALHTAGLAILLVWENAVADPAKGAALGTSHGTQARAYALDLGYPTGIPIIVAVDFNVQPAQIPHPVIDYLRAFRDAASWPIGVYGGKLAVDNAAIWDVSTLGWQTEAWSAGKVSTYADCLQHIHARPQIAALGAVDDNTVLHAFTAWSAPIPTPPAPTPTPTPTTEADDVRYIVQGDTSESVWLTDGITKTRLTPTTPGHPGTYDHYRVLSADAGYGIISGDAAGPLTFLRWPQTVIDDIPVTNSTLAAPVDTNAIAAGVIAALPPYPHVPTTAEIAQAVADTLATRLSA